ncbi:hypothetical protein KUTeg_020089 [Tegillarca granosa]|uniref:DUF6589 domain-containing protein n=1 Tax=Tegillarca granosa TaxID=220873 RepID=A0ABQ9E719_TEGGR|nr:hypothetical protein KUTeg_020089 [Tegillarca granosa]
MTETSKKSKYTLCELIDRSVNDSDGIITILDQIQRKYVPHTSTDHPTVSEKIVLGGDALTNDRAYSAQKAMANGTTDFECLGGFIHRPQCLHRMMNFVLSIYQTFYKESADQGTLWQLRNLIHRKDVSGSDAVTNRFRSHHTFIDDCLDAYIVAACVKYFSLDGIDSTPKANGFNPLFFYVPTQKNTSGYFSKGNNCGISHVSRLRELISDLDSDEQKIQDVKFGENYQCIYKRVQPLSKHMATVHDWHFHSSDKEIPSETNRYGDGGRAMRNIKFEYIIAGVAFEYKWNITSNLNGGKGQNIPNDNLVEMKNCLLHVVLFMHKY